jgi:hypothetical protein
MEYRKNSTLQFTILRSPLTVSDDSYFIFRIILSPVGISARALEGGKLYPVKRTFVPGHVIITWLLPEHLRGGSAPTLEVAEPRTGVQTIEPPNTIVSRSECLLLGHGDTRCGLSCGDRPGGIFQCILDSMISCR